MKFIIILILAVGAITAWLYLQDNKNNKKQRYKKTKTPKLTPEEKGEIGERTIKEKILRELNHNERILNNYIIKGSSAETSQIDHIVIKPSGIYVIETKNYEGKIYGSINDFKWTQVMAGGHVKNTFYNPLKQNQTHIKNIRTYIDKKVPIYSMVVFIHADINEIAWIKEIYTPHTMMLNFEYHSDEHYLSDEEILEIYQKLKDNREYISNYEHVQNVNKYLSK